MTGHKSSVTTVIFSYDGRFLGSGGYDNHVLLWDIAHGHLLGDFTHHTAMVTNLCFSRCSTGMDTNAKFLPTAFSHVVLEPTVEASNSALVTIF